MARPDLFPNDPDHSSLIRINDALRSGQIKGFFADPMANLEQIPKKRRAAYFGGVRAIVEGSETIMPDGRSKMTMVVKSDPTAHPGLPGILVDRIKDGLALSVRILRCPRIALPQAPEIDDAWYVVDANEAKRKARQDALFAALRDRAARRWQRSAKK